MEENSVLKKRFEELYNRSYMQNYNTFTQFLNIEEQSILKNMRLPYTAFGGYDMAERIVAGFGDIYDNGIFPVKCLCISPVSRKFADALTHRDYLGSLMNLGIKREMLGDIIIDDDRAYLFCLEQIADYICENLKRIKHTTVNAEYSDSLPDNALKPPEITEFIVPSLRLDVLVCKVYNLSRGEGARLFLSGKVFVNSRQTDNSSYTVKENDIISVRGFGRFIFEKVTRKTKKDRLAAAVRIY